MDGRPKRIKKFAFTSVCVYNRLRVDGALGIFTSKSCKNGKEMNKKVCCTCKVVVLLIKPIVFLTF